MKKTSSIYPVFVIVALLTFAWACKKEDPATKASLSTVAVTSITASTATSGGTISSDGGAYVTANGICWNTSGNPSINDSKTSDAVGKEKFVSSITGLAPGTTYHVRAYATNEVGTSYGEDVTFLTLGEAPSCLTQDATELTATGAKLNGTVNPHDLSSEVTFEYGTSTDYGTAVSASQSPVTGSSNTNVSISLTGLIPLTTYHYRIKTINLLGTSFGEDKTFATLGQAPAATTLDATSKTAVSASLNGSVNAHNSSTIVKFEYGTTDSFGTSVTAIQSPVTGNNVTSVSADISGLIPNTLYYARLKAENSTGTTYGSQITFTTESLSQIKAEQILTSGKTGYGNAISVYGNLAVVGAGWEHTTAANKAGAVYVYEFDGSQWIEKQRITSPNPGYDKIFGQSVATNGQYIVITEPWNESAYIYSKSGSQWVLEKTITVNNVSSEIFAISCDISENTVVIGSGAVFALYSSAIGSAYVYEKNGSSWNNTAILNPSGGLSHDCFGVSVSIDKNCIAVGAGHSDGYVGTQGYVCIFEKNGSSWIESEKLFAPDGTDGNRFGERVDIESGKLFVSATAVGASYYFEKNGSWEFRQKVTSPDPAGSDSFGSPVSLSNNYVMIDANGVDDSYSNQGAAYLFEFDGTTWNPGRRILPSNPVKDGTFGYPLFLYNNIVFATNYIRSTDINEVHVFSLE